MHNILIKGSVNEIHGLLAVFTPCNKFANHRIVIHRNLATFLSRMPNRGSADLLVFYEGLIRTAMTVCAKVRLMQHRRPLRLKLHSAPLPAPTPTAASTASPAHSSAPLPTLFPPTPSSRLKGGAVALDIFWRWESVHYLLVLIDIP